MRIQHNIMAMNAYRNYNTNTSALSKNLEKLSSGYKINRAGDDAAGLAVSEKMRAQITGLNVAQKNAQDGISLVQTAEGALTEVHDMLNRMYELAELSSNGTYDATDRNQYQKEFDELRNEIDRIADSTNFNGIQLLNGEGAGGSGASALEISGTLSGGALAASKASAQAAEYEITVSGTGKVNIGGVEFAFASGSITTSSATLEGFSVAISGSKVTLTAKEAGPNTAPTVEGSGATLTTKTPGLGEHNVYKATSATFSTGDTVTIDGKTYMYASSANGSDGATFGSFTALQAAAAKNGVTIAGSAMNGFYAYKAGDGSGGDGLVLQIGDTGDTYNRLALSIDSIKPGALRDLTEGTGKVLTDLDISSMDDAAEAMKSLKGMINYVSDIRGGLGATQNRLEHTINNLSVMEENIQNAESAIRDTDVADEMMAYTKNNILIQSAQAMLAQANQVPQGVLQLMQ